MGGEPLISDEDIPDEKPDIEKEMDRAADTSSSGFLQWRVR